MRVACKHECHEGSWIGGKWAPVLCWSHPVCCSVALDALMASL